MLKIYGSMLCPDCVECRNCLDKKGITYEYFDFADSLLYLKEFLAVRDSNPIFQNVRADRKIGIPCLILEDGTVTLDWESYVSQDNA